MGLSYPSTAGESVMPVARRHARSRDSGLDHTFPLSASGWDDTNIHRAHAVAIAPE